MKCNQLFQKLLEFMAFLFRKTKISRFGKIEEKRYAHKPHIIFYF